MDREYLMENEEEARRLELKTDGAVVESTARRAGLRPGMRVVDIACGAGLTTSLLAGVVGGEGSALGLDASPERVARARSLYGGPRVEFAVRDFLEPLGDLGPFDFAWVRFALEYYRAEAFEIARNVFSLLAEGGTLCLVDLDHNCLNHWEMPPRLAAALEAAMRQAEERGNFDPYAGRKLYSHLHRLGCADIRVEAGAHHLIYGALRDIDEYNWMRKIEVVSGRIGLELPGYADAAAFREDFRAFFRDPGRFTYTPLIAAWGRKASG